MVETLQGCICLGRVPDNKHNQDVETDAQVTDVSLRKSETNGSSRKDILNSLMNLNVTTLQVVHVFEAYLLQYSRGQMSAHA